MARMKGRLFDRSRYVKKYSYVRAPKNLSYIGDKNLEMEAIRVSFNNESSKEVKFELPFNGIDYNVSLTTRQTASESEDSASVSLSIDPNGRDESGFTIRASAPFTGQVDVLVVRMSNTV